MHENRFKTPSGDSDKTGQANAAYFSYDLDANKEKSFCCKDSISSVPTILKIAKSSSEFKRIWDLRDREFTAHYIEFSTRHNDSFDDTACVLYGTDQEGNITSTARVVFDTAFGLPSDKHHKDILDDLRGSGKKLAELSKLVISKQARGMLRQYMKSSYEIAVVCNVSSLIITCLSKSTGAYQRMVGAKILVPDIGYRFGTDRPFSLLEWDIKRSKEPLQKWLRKELV